MTICVCCQRGIAEGELCSDCAAEVRTFVETWNVHRFGGLFQPIRVMDVMAEFDLTEAHAIARGGCEITPADWDAAIDDTEYPYEPEKGGTAG